MSMVEMRYDRRVSGPALDLLVDADVVPSLVALAERPLIDLQLRGAASGAPTLSLYVGMTVVLEVRSVAAGYRLHAHETHRGNGGFDERWRKAMPLDELVAAWPSVFAYVERVIPTVNTSHTAHEGAVHAAMCSGRADSYVVADREAAVGFTNTAARDEWCGPVQRRLHEAVTAASNGERWWPGTTAKLPAFGTGLDVLALDPAGRLLVMEAKPAGALKGIVWGPAQVMFYAELFAAWIEQTPGWADVVRGEADQRHRVGLGAACPTPLEPAVVVPVLAVGAGTLSKQAWPRAFEIRRAIHRAERSPLVADVEIWRLDADGEPTSRQ